MIGRAFADEFSFFGPSVEGSESREDLRDCPGCGRKSLSAAGETGTSVCGHCGWREGEVKV